MNTAPSKQDARPWPVELVFDRAARHLSIAFDDGATFSIPFELLRVESPSAEVQGHGGRKVLVRGKADIGVIGADPVGRYAVRIRFDDGHSTGIYSWEFLRTLGAGAEQKLKAYREQLQTGG